MASQEQLAFELLPLSSAIRKLDVFEPMVDSSVVPSRYGGTENFEELQVLQPCDEDPVLQQKCKRLSISSLSKLKEKDAVFSTPTAKKNFLDIWEGRFIQHIYYDPTSNPYAIQFAAVSLESAGSHRSLKRDMISCRSDDNDDAKNRTTTLISQTTGEDLDLEKDDSRRLESHRIQVSGETIAGGHVAFDCVDGAFLTITIQYINSRLDIHQVLHKNALGGDLTEDQSRKLVWRLLHLVLRSYGSVLHFKAAFSLLDGVGRRIHQEYISMRNWADLADLNLVVLDVACTWICVPDEKAQLLYQCGVMFQAASRYREAATLYMRCIDPDIFLAQGASVNFTTKTELYLFAAKAYGCAGDYELSEEADVKGLRANWLDQTQRLSPKPWDGDAEYPRVMFYNLLCVYRWHTKDGASGLLLCALGSLMEAAGYHSLTEAAGYHSGTRYASYLRQKFVSKKKAIIALSQAVSLGNVKNFRSTLVDCLRPQFIQSFRLTPERFIGAIQRTPDLPRQHLKLYRRVVLKSKWYAESKVTTSNLERCHHPTCPKTVSLGQLLTCPCKAAAYCCKSCQVEDWISHKKSCLFHKNRRQTNRGTQGATNAT